MIINEEIARNIINEVCENFVDCLLTGLEEYKEDFYYTILIIEFVSKCDDKIDNIFISEFLDKVNIECANYLARKEG